MIQDYAKIGTEEPYIHKHETWNMKIEELTNRQKNIIPQKIET